MFSLDNEVFTYMQTKSRMHSINETFFRNISNKFDKTLKNIYFNYFIIHR